MHASGRNRDTSGHLLDEFTEEGPALRDAMTAAKRAADDEAAADAARDLLRLDTMQSLKPDDAIGPHIADGELVHALRTRAILKAPGDDRALGYGGTLYLTSRRLVHLGQVMVTVQLTDIVETSLAGERLLLTLRDGEGIALDLDRPRLLRAEMAAVVQGLRR